MGWYNGDGARKMTASAIQLTGTTQTIPTPTTDGLFECNWSLSYKLSVPTDWVSGIYLAKLTKTSGGKQSYIIFVVRDDSRLSLRIILDRYSRGKRAPTDQELRDVRLQITPRR
jgi:hypothetical protein